MVRATLNCIRLLRGELFYFKDLRGISSVNSSLLHLAQEQKHSKKPGVRWGGLRTQHGGLGGVVRTFSLCPGRNGVSPVQPANPRGLHDLVAGMELAAFGTFLFQC